LQFKKSNKTHLNLILQQNKCQRRLPCISSGTMSYTSAVHSRQGILFLLVSVYVRLCVSKNSEKLLIRNWHYLLSTCYGGS